MALLGVCLQLGLQGRKLGKRRVGVGLLLALPALRRLPAILMVVAVLVALVLVALVLAILGVGRRPVTGAPFAA
jgi:hypothetical protein